MRWLLPVLALLLFGNCSRQAWQAHYARSFETTVYIVRHAEKELTPGLADPPLTPAGQQRALALRDSLRHNVMLAAIFSTNTTRTRTTAQPLAQKLKLPIQPYDASQLAALASRIRREYKGREVLIVGHSNTILETAEALGAKRPVPAIGDNEYNYLLEVNIPRDSTQAATAVARRYGRSN
jgi:broad specificity phosphatase PhoE